MMVADQRGRQLSRRWLFQSAGLAGLGLLVGCGRLPGQAGPAVARHRIGMLTLTSRETRSIPAPGVLPILDAFRQGLREYGYVEGQNLSIEYRGTSEGPNRLAELAAELAALPVEVIVAQAGTAQPAARATAAVPIVFIGGGDPILLQLVESLGRPGRNATGLPVAPVGTLLGKQLEFIKDMVPGLSRVAVLRDAIANEDRPLGSPALGMAQALGLELSLLPVHTTDEIQSAIDAAVQDHVQALYHEDNSLLARNQTLIMHLLAKHRLPALGIFRAFAEAGGLMSYGTSLPGLYRRAAYYVDRILKGAKPADLPVEQPREFDFVINLRTAQALGIAIPQHVLLQATEIIQ
jgi:putative ABC transport system substrate-binding protein